MNVKRINNEKSYVQEGCYIVDSIHFNCQSCKCFPLPHCLHDNQYDL